MESNTCNFRHLDLYNRFARGQYKEIYRVQLELIDDHYSSAAEATIMTDDEAAFVQTSDSRSKLANLKKHMISESINDGDDNVDKSKRQKAPSVSENIFASLKKHRVSESIDDGDNACKSKRGKSFPNKDTTTDNKSRETVEPSVSTIPDRTNKQQENNSSAKPQCQQNSVESIIDSEISDKSLLRFQSDKHLKPGNYVLPNRESLVKFLKENGFAVAQNNQETDCFEQSKDLCSGVKTESANKLPKNSNTHKKSVTKNMYEKPTFYTKPTSKKLKPEKNELDIKMKPCSEMLCCHSACCRLHPQRNLSLKSKIKKKNILPEGQAISAAFPSVKETKVVTGYLKGVSNVPVVNDHNGNTPDSNGHDMCEQDAVSEKVVVLHSNSGDILECTPMFSLNHTNNLQQKSESDHTNNLQQKSESDHTNKLQQKSIAVNNHVDLAHGIDLISSNDDKNNPEKCLTVSVRNTGDSIILDENKNNTPVQAPKFVGSLCTNISNALTTNDVPRCKSVFSTPQSLPIVQIRDTSQSSSRDSKLNKVAENFQGGDHFNNSLDALATVAEAVNQDIDKSSVTLSTVQNTQKEGSLDVLENIFKHIEIQSVNKNGILQLNMKVKPSACEAYPGLYEPENVEMRRTFISCLYRILSMRKHYQP